MITWIFPLYFNRYIGRQTDRRALQTLDPHWRPQHLLCSPCIVNYDYIVDFDNMHEDGNRLLQYVQRNDKNKPRVKFDESVTSHVDSNRTKEQFKGISKGLVQKIRSIFHYDFLLLNYSTTLYT